MSIFKSKKTYIKRYAFKNSDKKITFAPSVKSKFSAPISDVKPVSKTEIPTKESNKPQGPAGTIRFARDIEYKNSFTEVKPSYTKATVVSGPAIRRPEPIEKPDLTGVKAEGKVRPVIDGQVVFSRADEKADLSEKSLQNTIKKQDDVQNIQCEKQPEVQNTQSKIQPEPDNKQSENLQIEQQAVKEKDIKTDLHKEFESKQTKSEKKPKSAPKHKAKKPRKKSKFSAGNVVAIVAKISLLIVLICAVGFAGFKFFTKYKTEVAQLNTALSTQYPAEDYIYPKVPDDILEKNAIARQQAEQNAAANAYVPSSYEVPNLYKYDYVKTCYLTFDDGPSPNVTAKVLDILKENDIKATFFVTGENAKAYPDIIKRMDAEGHSIGNHSYSHNYSELYADDSSFDSSLIACKNAINEILGRDYQNKIFRFPGGMFGKPASWYTYNINAEGYQYINWNALTGDSEGEVENPDSEYLMNKLKESTNNGTTEDIVVLMHDAGAKQVTADTLPQIIEYLKRKNYIFKPIYNSNYTPQ